MPRFMEQLEVSAISHLRANASWSGFSAGEDSQTAIYNPPPGWVVLQTQVVVHSSNNGSRAVSTLAGGLALATESLIEKTYDDAIKASARYADKSIGGKLEQEKKTRINEIRKWSTNRNTIEAKVSCSAHGSAFDRKRGWEEDSVIATLIYIAEPSRNSIVSEIEQNYKIDVDAMTHQAITDEHAINPAAGPDPVQLAERSQPDQRLEPQLNKP